MTIRRMVLRTIVPDAVEWGAGQDEKRKQIHGDRTAPFKRKKKKGGRRYLSGRALRVVGRLR